MPPMNSVVAARFGLWAVVQLVSCGCGLMFLGPSAESDQFGKEIMPLLTASRLYGCGRACDQLLHEFPASHKSERSYFLSL
jgi:hypothetical protein